MQVLPVTKERWADLEQLFGPRGAFWGCWCMAWRLTRRELEENKSAGNRAAMKGLIEAGTVPGVLAYDEDQPVGWCAVAPRSELGALERSRILKPLDDKPVWSITCFFIGKAYRGQGLMDILIQGAIEFVRERGGGTIEAYPHAPIENRLSPVSVYTGVPGPFERAGFTLCKQASKAKLIMRLELDD